MASAIRQLTHRPWALTKHIPPHPTHSSIRLLQTPSPIHEKYRTKLSAKLKAAGATTLNELLNTVPPSAAPTQQQPPLTHALPGIKPLSSFVDVEKLHTLTLKQIEYIWRARFVSNPHSICAVIPHEKYSKMEADARKHPMFLLPLPRAGGIELQFLQWSFPSRDSSTVIFTALEEYRLRGEWATPHTTLTHHLELVAGKKVVLSQGAVGAGCGVTADDARLLIVALQKFYGVGDGESGRRRRRLLELFSSGDDGFSAENLVDEVERID